MRCLTHLSANPALHKAVFWVLLLFFGSDSMGKRKQMGYEDQRVLGLCEMGSEQTGLGVTGFI